MKSPMAFKRHPKKIPSMGLIGIFTGMALLACSEPSDKTDKLEIKTASPITLVVGDTSSVLIVSRTTTDPRGRSSTNPSYRSFYLTSQDANIAAIADLQRIWGLAVGEVKVVAKDEKSALISDSITVKVVAKP